MRKLVAVLCVSSLAGTANADFDGPYAPGNWTLVDTAGGIGSLNATTMSLTGGDVRIAGITEFRITAPADASLSFEWNYSSRDTGTYDNGYFSINGSRVIFADNENQGNGSSDIGVSGGDLFAIGVETIDGLFGAGNLTVTNFVPEPGSLALLGMGVLVLLRRRQ